jgi:isopentenyl-diphosphate delta-isomerase
MTAPSTQHGVVSSEEEPLIRVDSADRPIGTLDKSACHDGAGLLHRAFSIFVFNRRGQLLLQQRHPDKRLWPSYWSNSCCSHPRAGEDMDTAVARRLQQELGLVAEARFLYKFEYRAEFGDVGTEHELCWVYVGTTDAKPVINTTEIADWRWIAPDDLDRELARSPERFTPWFKLEWQRLRGEFGARIAALGGGITSI